MEDSRALVRIPLLEPSPLTPYREWIEERWEPHDNFALLSEGDDVDGNVAIVYGPVTPQDFFEAARRFYGDAGFAVLVESETAAPVEERLRADGWRLDEEEIAMVLEPIPDAPASPPKLDIRPVTSDGGYEDFMTVVPGNREWIPSLKAATDPRVALFVGYVDDQPVATARLTCFPGVCEILGVTTLEPWRRRGYGEALTWAATQEGRQRGCPTAILTATEMGYSVYLRMGFREVCAYRTYLPPASA